MPTAEVVAGGLHLAWFHFHSVYFCGLQKEEHRKNKAKEKLTGVGPILMPQRRKVK